MHKPLPERIALVRRALDEHTEPSMARLRLLGDLVHLEGCALFLPSVELRQIEPHRFVLRPTQVIG